MLEKYRAFLDVDSAMPFVADDPDIYEAVVETYCEDDKIALLEECFENNDWDNYRINVHGVKSSSYTIGAVELGDEAKASEDCLKAGDIDGARARHQKIMADYRAVLDKIREIL